MQSYADHISSRGLTPQVLGELNVELEKLRKTKPDSALCRAHFLRPQLLGADHKNSFLHTENFDVKAAADRIASYWEARAGLFGEERMLLPMGRIGSLESDSLALNQGVLQLLQHTDLEGRGLIFFDPSRHDTTAGYPIESMLRVVWYVMHVAMEDPVIRANGFVLIVYPKGSKQIDHELIAKGTAIIGKLMPLRWRGIHICHPCSEYNKYFPIVKMLSPHDMKDNIAVHFGTEAHVLKCMASYSLPADRLPTALGGTVDLDYSKWISDRRELEGAVGGVLSSSLCPVADRLESSDAVMEDVLTTEGSTKVEEPALAPAVAPPSTTKKPKAKPRKRAATAPSPPIMDPEASRTSAAAASKAKRPGRKGDSRMHCAVTLKIGNPGISLVESLQAGGFNFVGLNEKGRPHHEVFDQDNVSLMQRKNQLLRRIRVEKKKKEEAL